MKKENKVILFFLLVSIIVPMLFILIFLHDNTKIEKISLDGIVQIQTIAEYGIENVDISDETITLTGWLIETPNTITKVERNFILVCNDNVYKLNTILKTRNDITERWNNGNNYDNCGLEGNGLAKYINTGRYRIGFLINDDNEKRYFLTDEFLEVH